MTGAEAKQALVSGEPVMFDDIEYKCITQILYSRCKEGIAVSAVLLDYTERSTMTVPIRRLRHSTKHNEQIAIPAETIINPIESIRLQTYYGDLNIELSVSDDTCSVVEGGALALPASETPYHYNDSVPDTVGSILCRIRDTAMMVLDSWRRARE